MHFGYHHLQDGAASPDAVDRSVDRQPSVLLFGKSLSKEGGTHRGKAQYRCHGTTDCIGGVRMESDQENSGGFAPKKHDEIEGKEKFILGI